MPTNDCLPHVNACIIRVTRLQSDGVPLPGANNIIVSDAMTRVGFSWETDEGEEVNEKNACGDIKVYYRSAAQLVRGNLEIELITRDPDLSELLSGGSVISGTAYQGVTPSGYAAPSLGAVTDAPVSVEVWAKRIRNGKLDDAFPYAWWVYPYVTNLRPDDHEHAAGNLGATFMGEAYENLNWFNGPNNDWPAASTQVYQWTPTRSIPVAICGYQTLAAS